MNVNLCNSLSINDLQSAGGPRVVTRLVLGSYVSLPLHFVFTMCACYVM
jgi:hypothetical protein